MTIAYDELLNHEASSVADLLDRTLEKVVNVFEQAGVSLPERRYWTMQRPVADCEQVVVSLLQIFYGAPGDNASSPVRCNGPRSAAMQVQVIRCVPTASASGRAPTPQKIQDGSRQIAIDSWLLLDAAGLLGEWEDPNTGMYGPGVGVIATVDTDEWSGGFGGTTLSVTVGIE